jgi:hypothetical protein
MSDKDAEQVFGGFTARDGRPVGGYEERGATGQLSEGAFGAIGKGASAMAYTPSPETPPAGNASGSDSNE